MEDKLRKWVDAQRDEFEIHDLDTDQGWEQVSTRLARAGAKTSGSRKWLSVAASVIALLVAGAVLYPLLTGPEDPSESIFSGNYELSEARNYYTSEINVRLAAAKRLVDDPTIFEDIEELDKALAELKNDLKDNADNEEVIIAMMENYQLKLKILDRILDHLKKKEMSDKRKNEEEVQNEII